MGDWLARFLESEGHRPVIWDIQSSGHSRFPLAESLAEGLCHADFVALATPISATAKVLNELISLKPQGIVFDLAFRQKTVYFRFPEGAKNGTRRGFDSPSLRSFGCFAFGPTSHSLRREKKGTGNAVEALFRPSAVQITRLTLEEHDEVMGYVLGLSHLVNLVFGLTLAKAASPIANSQGVASTTFGAQTQIARSVALENQDLYYEIQAENPACQRVLKRFERALDAYSQSIKKENRARFKSLNAVGVPLFSNREGKVVSYAGDIFKNTKFQGEVIPARR